MLMLGDGVEKNVPLAKQYFLMAVGQNQGKACVNLADILIKGLDGSAPNRPAGITLLERARDGGNRAAVDALARLGL
jgi:TPR repeat protein